MLSRQISRIALKFTSSNTSLSFMDPNEKEQYLRKLQENAQVNYKVYPALPHQDPLSSQYIHSELDQYHDKVEVQAYNQIIDQFKHDLKVQREVWNAISNLDRPYKRGIRGIDTNLDPNGVHQPEMENIGIKRTKIDNSDAFVLNQNRFIDSTLFIMKKKPHNVVEWELERLNRPVTKDYNHNKGYKYDVATKPEEKYEFMADRLGHPEFLGTPVDRLFKLQNDIFHPTYLQQPFVSMPSTKPDPNLNFEQGEVLYENTRVLEWLKFWQLGAFTGGAFFGMYVPATMLYKSNLVTQAVDQVAIIKYHLVSPCSVDILRAGIPVGAGLIAYSVYLILNMSNLLAGEYVIKMTYSKDKELLFVKRIDLHGQLYQEVYEMAHLEILPPNQRSALKHLSSQDEDGLWRITCLNTRKTMLVYNDHDHWNHTLRHQFFKRTLGLWDKSYYGYDRKEKEQFEAQAKEHQQPFQALPKQ